MSAESEIQRQRSHDPRQKRRRANLYDERTMKRIQMIQLESTLHRAYYTIQRMKA
jgi:hypothetical protein